MSGARFTSIKPKLFDSRIFHDAFVDAAEKVMQDSAQSFTDATKDWKHKPEFIGTVKVTNKNIAITIQTDDKIFKFVDEGTKAHIIRPVNRKFLRWNNGPGGVGGDDVFAREVHHPGYKGSKISESVQAIWSDLMPDYFDEALRKTALETGHAL